MLESTDSSHEADAATEMRTSRFWVTWALVTVPLAAGGWLVALGFTEHQLHQRHAEFVAQTVEAEFGMRGPVPTDHLLMEWHDDRGVVACRYTPAIEGGEKVEQHFCAVSPGVASERSLPIVVDGPEGFRARFVAMGAPDTTP